MKKKYSASNKDKKEWLEFTKNMGSINPKDIDTTIQNNNKQKTNKLDLHGSSLEEANNLVEKFIINSFKKGYKKLIIVTGKGLRSKTYQDPYASQKLSILRNSVPNFINNNEKLNKKIIKISKADISDGGEGAIYIFLKNNKNL